MLASTTYILLAAFGSSTYALAFNGARATAVGKPCGKGDLLHPPQPTKPPYLDPELLKRQDLQTDLVAPDNTCGYFSGLAGAAYYCNALTEKCALFPSTSGTWGFIGCCNTLNCGARLTCIDSSQYYSQTICDNGCEKDTYTLKCTATSAPYCNGIRFPNEGVQDYFCDEIYVSTWQTAETTYLNELGRTFSPITVTLTTTGGTTASSNLAASSSSTETTDISSTTGSATTNSQASQTSSASPSSTTSAVPPKKSTPVGAIAGGAVGGVVVLAALGFGLFFLLRRQHKKTADTNDPQAAPSYASPGQGDSAYANNAVKPVPLAQETQFTGTYGPQGYAPVPQGQYSQQAPYGQQLYQPQMAEAPGNSSYPPVAAAYDPHHSSISQAPTTPYSLHSQPMSPNSASHLSAAYPDRGDTTSPTSLNRMSGEPGESTSSHMGGSPPQQYQSYTPYVPPAPQGGQEPAEMQATMAGPWPTNLHEGTWEAPGSEVRPQGHQ